MAKKNKTYTTEMVQAIYDQGTYMKPSAAVGKAIIRCLFDFGGCNEDAAREAYQSKHVRWFADRLGGLPKTGKSTYRLFKRYLNKDSNHINIHIALWQGSSSAPSHDGQ